MALFSWPSYGNYSKPKLPTQPFHVNSATRISIFEKVTTRNNENRVHFLSVTYTMVPYCLFHYFLHVFLAVLVRSIPCITSRYGRLIFIIVFSRLPCPLFGRLIWLLAFFSYRLPCLLAVSILFFKLEKCFRDSPQSREGPQIYYPFTAQPSYS